MINRYQITYSVDGSKPITTIRDARTQRGAEALVQNETNGIVHIIKVIKL